MVSLPFLRSCPWRIVVRLLPRVNAVAACARSPERVGIELVVISSRPYRVVLLGAFLGALLSCGSLGQDPREPEGVRRSAVQVSVMDYAVFEHITEFEVHVFKALTVDGDKVSCVNIPDAYDAGSDKLVRVGQVVKVAADPDNETKPVKTEKPIRVPANEALVFVARGLAPWTGIGTFTVGRACRDNVRLDGGKTHSLPLDVRATTGARCITDADCKPHLSCHQGLGYGSGYCAFKGCSRGGSCPPGSVCIPHEATGGLCMRRCRSIQDCAVVPTDAQDCEGRKGSDTSEACSRVCVHSLWEKDLCCHNCKAGSGS